MITGNLNSISMTDLASSIARLAVSDSTNQPASSPYTPSLSHPIANTNTIAQPTLPSCTPSPPYTLSQPHASMIAELGHSKQDSNQHSARAMKLLANIDTCTQRCFCLLSDTSDASLTDVSSKLSVLRLATGHIRVDSRKLLSNHQVHAHYSLFTRHL